jgi:hypothetical protein
MRLGWTHKDKFQWIDEFRSDTHDKQELTEKTYRKVSIVIGMIYEFGEPTSTTLQCSFRIPSLKGSRQVGIGWTLHPASRDSIASLIQNDATTATSKTGLEVDESTIGLVRWSDYAPPTVLLSPNVGEGGQHSSKMSIIQLCCETTPLQ